MGALAGILPGLREIRGPLAAGYLWLLFGWLIVKDDVTVAGGVTARLVELGGQLNDAALAAAASFAAYLIGSLSEDVFRRALRTIPILIARIASMNPLFDADVRDEARRPRTSIEEMGRAQVESEIAHLENQTSRLDAESSLRIAILPPLVAIWVYFVLFDSWSWVFAGVFLPSLFAQAYVRITDLEVASQSLFELRRHLGLPPRSAREAEELPVTRVMIPEDDIVSYDVGTSERLEDIPLSAIRDRMRQMDPPSRRMPIRNSAGTVLYVIQASTLTSYAEMQGQTTFTLDKSFGDLLAVPEFKELVEAIGFVPENATVDEARMVMGAIANCENVFVTSNGRRDERAIGWLTTPLLASSTGRGTLGAAGR